MSTCTWAASSIARASWPLRWPIAEPARSKPLDPFKEPRIRGICSLKDPSPTGLTPSGPAGFS
eukprot:8917813-Pyramimonas_sp.AAC.1